MSAEAPSASVSLAAMACAVCGGSVANRLATIVVSDDELTAFCLEPCAKSKGWPWLFKRGQQQELPV